MSNQYRVSYEVREGDALGSFAWETFEVQADSAEGALEAVRLEIQAQGRDSRMPRWVMRLTAHGSWARVPWFAHDDSRCPPGGPGLREDLLGGAS